mgnify:CR=1 FL=1
MLDNNVIFYFLQTCFLVVGELPLAMALKGRYIVKRKCFFYATIDKDGKYRFIICPIAKNYLHCYITTWASLTDMVLLHFQWVFIGGVKSSTYPIT